METGHAYHEIASIFPMMDDAAFDDLCADISEQGQLDPIWLHEGKILDGRNRYKACNKLGIEPAFREWQGAGSPINFVLSLNLHRRHLTSSQKAVVALRMLPMMEAEAKERQLAGVPVILPEGIKHDSRDQAAALVGVSGKYVSDLKSIEKNAPKLMKQIESGKMSIPEAKREIGTAKKPARDMKKNPCSTAAQFSHIAISQLTRIRDDDPQAINELHAVIAWAQARIKTLTRP